MKNKIITHELFKRIYGLGFANGAMAECGLERNECDDNYEYLARKGDLNINSFIIDGKLKNARLETIRETNSYRRIKLRMDFKELFYNELKENLFTENQLNMIMKCLNSAENKLPGA